MAEWLEHSLLVLKLPGSKYTGLSITRSVHAAVTGYLVLLRAGEGEGRGEEGEWRLASVTPMSVHVGSLTATSPQGHQWLWENQSNYIGCPTSSPTENSETACPVRITVPEKSLPYTRFCFGEGEQKASAPRDVS